MDNLLAYADEHIQDLFLAGNGRLGIVEPHAIRLLWDQDGKKQEYKFKGSSEALCACWIGGDTVVSGAFKELSVWELGKADRTLHVPAHEAEIWCIESMLDGTILTCSEDRTMKVWDMRSWTCLRTIDTTPHTVSKAVCTAPRKAAVPLDNVIQLWDTSTSECFGTLTGHKGPVYRVANMCEPGRVASSSQDCTVKVWDLDTQTCVATIFCGEVPAFYIAPLLDGWIALCDGSSTVKVCSAHLTAANSVYSARITRITALNSTCIVAVSKDGTIRSGRVTVAGH